MITELTLEISPYGNNMVECFIFDTNGDFLLNLASNSHCVFQMWLLQFSLNTIVAFVWRVIFIWYPRVNTALVNLLKLSLKLKVYPSHPPKKEKGKAKTFLKIFLLYESGKYNKKEPRYGVFPEKFARSSHLQMLFKIAALKKFVIFTGKHLYWCLFLITLQTWRPATWDTDTGVFL